MTGITRAPSRESLVSINSTKGDSSHLGRATVSAHSLAQRLSSADVDMRLPVQNGHFLNALRVPVAQEKNLDQLLKGHEALIYLRDAKGMFRDHCLSAVAVLQHPMGIREKHPDIYRVITRKDDNTVELKEGRFARGSDGFYTLTFGKVTQYEIKTDERLVIKDEKIRIFNCTDSNRSPSQDNPENRKGSSYLLSPSPPVSLAVLPNSVLPVLTPSSSLSSQNDGSQGADPSGKQQDVSLTVSNSTTSQSLRSRAKGLFQNIVREFFSFFRRAEQGREVAVASRSAHAREVAVASRSAHARVELILTDAQKEQIPKLLPLLYKKIEAHKNSLDAKEDKNSLDAKEGKNSLDAKEDKNSSGRNQFYREGALTLELSQSIKSALDGIASNGGLTLGSLDNFAELGGLDVAVKSLLKSLNLIPDQTGVAKVNGQLSSLSTENKSMLKVLIAHLRKIYPKDADFYNLGVVIGPCICTEISALLMMREIGGAIMNSDVLKEDAKPVDTQSISFDSDDATVCIPPPPSSLASVSSTGCSDAD